MNFGNLKKQYNEEYLKILKELNESEYLKQSELQKWKMKIAEKELELQTLKEERIIAESNITWNLMQEEK